MDSFVGFDEQVRFYVGSKRGQRAMKKLLSQIGRKIEQAQLPNIQITKDLKIIYTKLMKEIAMKYQASQGDRLNLIFLEEQIQGMRGFSRDSTTMQQSAEAQLA